ncbi:MAG: bifunctional 4-hydroxy-2-oxoglutarate aldolase/2-dehydro-3-deoxy-phosphogluconate aldolase [Catenulispora sp.]|nr:bifunctional 4-hydroxy-2-oxoglutarate aldolase/2-dehydro-3-deoxy-phosphogluconate aldolase [Catenulispora sp.]
MTVGLPAVGNGPRIIPVITLESADVAEPLAQALAAGGIRCVEVTLRTPAAEDALRIMARHGGLVVGAGTVLTPEQAERAVAAGARFVVSPGLDEGVAAGCRALGVEHVPGIATAGELMHALRLRLSTVKLFPAEQLGGVSMLKALAAPFPQVSFMPTGGIGPGQMPAYLAHPSVVAVGGSWITPSDLLAGGDFDGVRRLAAEAVHAAQAVERSGP